jgi:uncharacterized protein
MTCDRDERPIESSVDPELIQLSSEECLQLLHTCEVGRVVYTDGALPAVTPVNYAFDDGRVVIRTASDSRLAAKLPGSIVAFEIDELDRRARSGWSVVVTGPGELVTDAERLIQVSRLPLVIWAPGDRQVVLEIAAVRLTGRRILPGNPADPTFAARQDPDLAARG